MTREYYNMDCMELMAKYPDKHFDLAIVDPPYGINADGMNLGNGIKKYKVEKKWDSKIPDKSYFNKLKRISKNQIIWGGNYFVEHLNNFRCFLIWNKLHGAGVDFADCELAWTSFNKVSKRFDFRPMGMDGGKIHPTQKPVALYIWLLQNYAKKGDLILDTHVGSASSLIACEKLGFDYVACELDKDYYEASVQRLKNFRAQLTMDFEDLD
jgi:site-specific DNA-methyltransferase (adenine-specific)